MIKLRWGANDEDLKFKGSAPFIKFALGENVKRSPANAGQQNRFPDTRMGVEEVLTDAFTRAKDYEKSWKMLLRIRKVSLHPEGILSWMPWWRY